MTLSTVTATSVETALPGCPTAPSPSNLHRYVMLASAIILNGTNIKVTYTQETGEPGVLLTFDGVISGNTMTGMLRFERVGSPGLGWTLNAPVTVTRTGV